MRIACIIHSLDGGGAERVIAALASRLAERQHEVTLFTLDDGLHNRHDLSPAVQRRSLNVMSNSRSLWQRLQNTRRRVNSIHNALFDGQQFDVVLSFCDRTNILTLMAGRRNGQTPVVISERSDPAQQRLGRIGEWMRDRAYPQAATIVALTETSATHLRSRFQVPIEVIASAVDTPPHPSNRKTAIANKRIVGVGRLEHEKGFDRLIDAFASLTPLAPDWSLRLLGEGSLRTQLERQVDQLGLTSRVEFAGWVRPIWNELSEATLFALPSRYEGFPSALLEAMAMGVPSVSVDCESGPRAILQQEMGSGLLVPNDTQSLADGIRQLIEDGELRESLGNNGRNVVDRFGWDAMVDRYEQVLQRNLTERNSETGDHNPIKQLSPRD
ncbi:MAG: glycosyltransferase family 4 protein [Rubripirellula sp.]